MNRSLLLIIADFLLLSLLALARFEETPEVIKEDVKEEAHATQDLMEVLQMSLEVERQSRKDLNKSLEDAQSQLEKSEKNRKIIDRNVLELKDKNKELEVGTQVLKNEKERLEDDKKALELIAEEKVRIEKEFNDTRDKLDKVQDERMAVSKDLSLVKQRHAASLERLNLIQSKLKEREAQIQKTGELLEKLSSDHRVSEIEKQKLETQLQVAMTEKKMIAQNLDMARSEIKVIAHEKLQAEKHAEKLATSITSLAENSELLHEEIQKMQPMTLNKIFELYKSNRVIVEFSSLLKNVLGEKPFHHKAYAVIVEDAGKAYALVLESFTPFTSLNVSKVSASITAGDKDLPIDKIYSLAGESRVVAAPVPLEWIKNNGIRSFKISSDPLRFSTSIVIGQKSKFGEVLLKQHPIFPNFFKRDSKLLTSIPGEVSASKGDLVFAKTGHFMGFMVNGRYAVVFSNLDTMNEIPLGQNFKVDDLVNAIEADRKALEILPKELR